MSDDRPDSDVPPVTALVPTYNGAKLIGGLLDSLHRQTYRNLLVLISDDRSSDNTVEVCQTFASGCHNVTVVTQERNLGWVGNSNYLLRAAKGEYVFFALHDDVLASTYVEQLVTALQADTKACLAYSDLLLAEEGKDPVRIVFDGLSSCDSALARGRMILCRPGTSWVAFRGVMRRETVLQVGGLRKHWLGERSADWFLTLGLALRGSFVRVPQTLYTKNKRREGVAAAWTRGTPMRLIIAWMGLLEVFRSPLSVSDKAVLIAEAVQLKFKRWVTRFIGG